MTADLVSLKILVVSGSESFLTLWRDGARLSSIPVEFVGTPSVDAVGELAKGDVDILVIDGEIAVAQRDSIADAARRCSPAPAFVLTSEKNDDKPEYVDFVAPPPGNLNVARSLVERFIRFRVPSRVLVVDDSGTMRSIVRKVLSASRYATDVGEAANGHEAINEVTNGGFEVVILDYNMPGLNGLDILRAIRKTQPEIGVVLMTTTVDDHIAKAAIAEGATGFLKKPFYPADIDEVLDRYFGARICA
ncbi:MAG: response regulator [Pseudolabrys sp.]